MVIEESERRSDGEGVQPQRHLGQLHRHRVLVNAIHAPLEHHAPDHVTVVELLRMDGPALPAGVAKDRVANGVDVFDKRRDVPFHRRLRFGHGRDHPVSQVIHEADQEVPRSHGRVADLETEQLRSRIEAFERFELVPGGLPASAQSRRLGGEGIETGAHQRPNRLFEDQADEFVRSVVAARALARENVRADDDLPCVTNDLVLEEPLVDRSELLDAQVTIVDVASPLRSWFERQGVDDIRHDPIAQPHAVEERDTLSIEETAVVRRKADRRVADVDRPAEVVDGRPVAGGGLREGIAAVLAPRHIAPHLVTEGVVIVARVANRQQVAVLGVQDEQQAVEHDQGSIAYLSKWCVRCFVGNGAGEFGKYTAEYQVGQVGGDPLLVETAFF